MFVLEAGMPWPATLANVAEHVARTITNDWPRGEERWWPTKKAMEMAHEQH